MWKDIFCEYIRYSNAMRILLFGKDQRDKSLMKAAARKPYREHKRFDLNKFRKA